MKRPAVDYEFESIFGIQKSFGYTALRTNVVLQREWDCWCPACFDALSGPGRAKQIANNYQVAECRTQERWFECCVQRQDARGVYARRQEAQEAGRELVPQLQAGQWAAGQHPTKQDLEFPFELYKLLDSGPDKSCVIRQVTQRETIEGRSFYPRDFVLAV